MLRHCTMGELLEVRDRRGSVGARAHLEECAACRDELDRLHQRTAGLRALPSVTPPRDRWEVVRAAAVAARRRRWNRGLTVAGLAAAAVTVLAVGLPVVSGGPVGVDVVTEDPSVEIETLADQSRQLESVLVEVGRQPRVVNGMTASVIADLEDRIAWVDAGLEQAHTASATPREMADLWHQRVVLMNALVNAHVRQVGYEGF